MRKLFSEIFYCNLPKHLIPLKDRYKHYLSLTDNNLIPPDCGARIIVSSEYDALLRLQEETGSCCASIYFKNGETIDAHVHNHKFDYFPYETTAEEWLAYTLIHSGININYLNKQLKILEKRNPESRIDELQKVIDVPVKIVPVLQAFSGKEPYEVMNYLF